MVRIKYAIMLFFVLGAARGNEVAVIVTGEAHGSLQPCECPLDPDGGMARRASMLRALLKKHPAAVVINIGGDAAGGPFDAEFISTEDARLRTDCIVRSLTMMPLDAFVPGDEELAHGHDSIKAMAEKVPLVAANLRIEGIRKTVTIHRQGAAFLVSGLTMDSEWPLESPGQAMPLAAVAEASLVEFPAEPGVRILVCHLGEEHTRRIAHELARSARRPHIIVNAHSRRDPRNVFFVDEVPVVQFPALGRSIRTAILNLQDGKVEFKRVETHPLGPGIEPDQRVEPIVREYAGKRRDTNRKIQLTLFKMALCPYSPEVEKRILNLLPELSGHVDFTVRFVTSQNAEGRTTCMHGQKEKTESLVQAAVREFYPDLLPEYLRLRQEEPKSAWKDLAGEAGILPARIQGSINIGEAERFLAWDRSICNRLGIRASPVLMVGNRVIEGEPMVTRALSALCRLIPKSRRPSLCSAVPECFSDIDCHQPGKRGECENTGTPNAHCRHYPAVPVALSVIRPPVTAGDRSREIVEALRDFFPGLEVDYVDWPSPRAGKILTDYPFDVLPAYFAEPGIKAAGGFERVKETLVPLKNDGGFFIDPAATDSSYFFHRPYQKGRTVVFIPAGTDVGRQALSCIYEYFSHSAAAARPEIRPILILTEDRLEAPGGKACLEEALRILAVSRLHPEHLWPYIEALSKSAGTGYWEEPLKQAGLAPSLIKKESYSAEITTAAKSVAEDCLSLRLPAMVAVLLDNREMVLPADRGELLDLMMLQSR